MDEQLRAKAKIFYNLLDFDRPINFGLEELVENGQPEGLYVSGIHDEGSDPVVELAHQIDYSLSAGSYLFTGNRGTGKTTELMRLAKRLHEFDCEVFYVDMSKYLMLTRRIEVTDFLISMLGALSEKVSERFNKEVGKAGFFERAWSFLNSEVQFGEVSLPANPLGLKGALLQNPTFNEELQKRTRSKVQELVQQAREFVFEVVDLVRAERNDPNKKVVLIVDSVERLRGVGTLEQSNAVFQSAVQLFSADAEQLRFGSLSVIYTIPPYLQALAGALGSSYAGGCIYALPSVHVYECCLEPGQPPRPSEAGLTKMVDVVARRYTAYSEFFTDAQLRRVAQSSGGDLRDFFRMLRLAVTNLPIKGLSAVEQVIESAENAVRNDMLPIANDDREWLVKIDGVHQPELPSLDKLPSFARLQQGKYVLSYRNGEDWYAVHPLLREKLGIV